MTLKEYQRTLLDQVIPLLDDILYHEKCSHTVDQIKDEIKQVVKDYVGEEVQKHKVVEVSPKNSDKEFLRSILDGACCYCGSAATDEDHIVPVSIILNSGRRSGKLKRYPTVPSCQSCNGSLGNKLVLGIQERSKYIHRRLCEKRSSRRKIEWSRTVSSIPDRFLMVYLGLRQSEIRFVEAYQHVYEYRHVY